MQQRFCSVCGFSVWVQYDFSENGNKTFFWSRNDMRAENLKRCPCCTKQIDINTLA